MTDIEAKSKAIKRSIKRLNAKLKDVHNYIETRVELIEIETQLGLARENFNLLRDLQLELEELYEDTVLDKECEERNGFETEVEEVRKVLGECQAAFNEYAKSSRVSTSENTPGVSTGNGSTEIQTIVQKQHKIDVPKWVGEALNYTVWQKRFQAYVAKRNYDDDDSRHLMDEAMKDCPFRIRNMIATTDNATDAFKILDQAFGNADANVLKLIEKFKGLKKTDCSDVKDLQNLINNTRDFVVRMEGNGLGHEARAKYVFSDLLTKIDLSSRFAFRDAMEAQGKKQDIDSFVEYFQDRLRIMESSGMGYKRQNSSDSGTSSAKKSNVTKKGTKTLATSSTSSSADSGDGNKCGLCDEVGKHQATECPLFLGMEVKDRWSLVKKKNKCFNCLQSHRVANCPSPKECSGCTRTMKHITSLCEELASAANNVRAKEKEVILQVISVDVVTPKGNTSAVVLLDDGSETTLVSEGFLERAGLRGLNDTIEIVVPGRTLVRKPCKKTDLLLKTTEGSTVIEVKSLAKITTPVKRLPLAEIMKLPHLKDLPLKRPHGEIDILIGMDYDEVFKARDSRDGQEGQPRAWLSCFGWVLRGCKRKESIGTPSPASINTVSIEEFIQAEESGITNETCGCPRNEKKIREKQAAEEAKKSIQVRDDGCLELKNPKARADSVIPNNRRQHEEWFRKKEKTWKRKPEMKKRVGVQIDKMLSEGFVEEVPQAEVNDSMHYTSYLLVEAEGKPDRLVFDSSQKVDSTRTINDFYVDLYDNNNELIEVLLRFREGQFALQNDVSRMFSRVFLHPDDRDTRCFVWRDTETEPLKTYRNTRLLFGDKNAPALAQLALRKVAELEKDKYPSGAETIRYSMYRDDMLESTFTWSEAVKVKEEAERALEAHGFPLKGWSSNVAALSDGPLTTEKVLGLRWDQEADTLALNWKPKELPRTKRQLLAFLAGIFDPDGLFCPALTKLKILLQSTWRAGIDWDDKLPDDWNVKALVDELEGINEIKIPRTLYSGNFDVVTEIQAHCYVDSSSKALGFCLFLRWKWGDQVEIRLVAAKSRVAPLKVQSIPRLELSAACMGAAFTSEWKMKTRLPVTKIVYWTDSMVVLNWLHSDPRSHPTYIANRIGSIQSSTTVDEWRYICSEENYADQVSRGIPASEIESWSNGPPYLRLSEDDWPKTPEIKREHKEKLKVNVTSVPEKPTEWTPDVGDLVTAVHQVQLVMKAVKIWKNKTKKLPDSWEKQEVPSWDEVMEKLVRGVQRDFGCLKKMKDYKVDTMEQDGLVQVYSRIPASTPLCIIPKQSRLAVLICRYYHGQVLHGGAERTLAEVRAAGFWVIRARPIIKRLIKQCWVCRRYRGKPLCPPMADLPEDWFTQAAPFTFVMVDNFGPLPVKVGRNKIDKRYGLILVCMTTKATHLELSTDMSCEAFLESFYRFMARRGKPFQIRSDNGRNFVLAAKKLKSEGIDWKFSTPAAPFQRGLVEAYVGACKRPLNIVLQGQTLTPERLESVLIRIEGILNSRPICKNPEDPLDLETVITPNTLLLGRQSNLQNIKVPSVDPRVNPKLRLKVIEHLSRVFWENWTRSYLPMLRQRQKWQKEGDSLKENDVVIVCDKSVKDKGLWPLGRVITVYAGSNDVNRSAKILLKDGSTVDRSARCLIRLEQEDK